MSLLNLKSKSEPLYISKKTNNVRNIKRYRNGDIYHEKDFKKCALTVKNYDFFVTKMLPLLLTLSIFPV